MVFLVKLPGSSSTGAASIKAAVIEEAVLEAASYEQKAQTAHCSMNKSFQLQSYCQIIRI